MVVNWVCLSLEGRAVVEEDRPSWVEKRGPDKEVGWQAAMERGILLQDLLALSWGEEY
jgi:hypothetical protein